MGVPGGSATLEVIFARWEEVVGTAVAAHCRPVRLRDGVLVVSVDHPTWATQLRFLTPQLTEKVHELTGADTVSTLEIRVARKPR